MCLYFVLVPLALLLFLNLPLGDWLRKLSFPLACLMAAAQAILVVFLPESAFAGPSAVFGGMSFSFRADRLSLLFLLTIGIVSLASLGVAYGTATEEDEDSGPGSQPRSARPSRYAMLLVLATCGMNGLVLVRDLFSLYVFLEIVAASSYIMISTRHDADALEGAFKYLALSVIASLMLLSAIALFLLTAGSLSFDAVAACIASGGRNWQNILACALFAGGLCIKAGLVPFHGWLPDAYTAAPPGVSVLLAGIVTKSTGVYSLMRLSSSVFGFAFNIGPALTLIGLVTIVFGAFAAMGQRDIKRMLAYSSLCQVGYIFLGLGTGSALGFAAASSHMFNHATFKTQLFVNAASIERQTGTRDMDKLGGLAREMPITGWTSVLAFLSAAAIPPLGGFWSKLLSIIALWQAGNIPVAIAAIFTGLLTMVYFLLFQRKIFFGKPVQRERPVKEAPLSMLLPSIILAAITLGVGILFPLTFGSLILPIAAIP
jgi:Formate hydrogenlyase subunit 3/Multisubunit Na+/H+ antiporter, MnhD subunit